MEPLFRVLLKTFPLPPADDNLWLASSPVRGKYQRGICKQILMGCYAHVPKYVLCMHICEWLTPVWNPVWRLGLPNSLEHGNPCSFRFVGEAWRQEWLLCMNEEAPVAINFSWEWRFCGPGRYLISDQEGNRLKWQLSFPQRDRLFIMSPKFTVLCPQISLPFPPNSFSPSWVTCTHRLFPHFLLQAGRITWLSQGNVMWADDMLL